MANFLNDLNKMVNTVQKVDKLLTEKPKSTRLTKAEKDMICIMCTFWHETNTVNKFEVELLKNLKKKLVGS
jgi:hypothetical protein